MSVRPLLSTSKTNGCEDSLGTAEQTVTVNLTNSGISSVDQDLVPLVLTTTVSTDGELGQSGHSREERSLTTDYQTSVTHTICSPKLHISPPKSILCQSKYSRQD